MKQQIKCLSAFTATKTPNYYTGVRDSEVNIFRLPPIHCRLTGKTLIPHRKIWDENPWSLFKGYVETDSNLPAVFFTPNTRLLFKKQKQSKGESENIE